RLEELKCVCFQEFDIREAVQFGVPRGASQRVTGRVERGYAVGTCREVDGERAVVAEAVERSTARSCAGGDAVLALVQKGACLLAVPRSGEVARAVLHDLDLARDVSGQKLDIGREAFFHAERNVVAGEDA